LRLQLRRDEEDAAKEGKRSLRAEGTKAKARLRKKISVAKLAMQLSNKKKLIVKIRFFLYGKKEAQTKVRAYTHKHAKRGSRNIHFLGSSLPRWIREKKK